MPGLRICSLYMSGSKAQRVEIYLLFGQGIQEIYTSCIRPTNQLFEARQDGPNPIVQILSLEAVSCWGNKRSQQECDWHDFEMKNAWAMTNMVPLQNPNNEITSWSPLLITQKLVPDNWVLSTVVCWWQDVTGYPGPRLSKSVRKQGSANDRGKYLAPGCKKLPNVLFCLVFERTWA